MKENTWSGGKSENLFQKRNKVEDEVLNNLGEDELTLQEKGEKVKEKVYERRRNLKKDWEMESYAFELLRRFDSSENPDLRKEISGQSNFDEGVLLAWIWDIEEEEKEKGKKIQ